MIVRFLVSPLFTSLIELVNNVERCSSRGINSVLRILESNILL